MYRCQRFVVTERAEEAEDGNGALGFGKDGTGGKKGRTVGYALGGGEPCADGVEVVVGLQQSITAKEVRPMSLLLLSSLETSVIRSQLLLCCRCLSLLLLVYLESSLVLCAFSSQSVLLHISAGAALSGLSHKFLPLPPLPIIPTLLMALFVGIGIAWWSLV